MNYYSPRPHICDSVGWLSYVRDVGIIKRLRSSAVESVDNENVNALLRLPRVVLGRGGRVSRRGGLEWLSWSTILIVLMERK